MAYGVEICRFIQQLERKPSSAEEARNEGYKK